MRIRQFAKLALLVAVAVSAAPQAMAGHATVRVPVVRDRSTPIALEKEGVRVASYRFDRLMRASAGAFKGNQAPNVKLSVVNDATSLRAFSVAVAIFDKDGGLLAAGSGEKEKLKPGEAGDLTVEFEGVNQNLSRAEWIYVALETHLE